MEINEEIKKFMRNYVNINRTRLDKARHTTEALSDFLQTNLDGYIGSAYQGSFAYNTIIKPNPDTEEGQYDVDLAIKLSYIKDYKGGETKYYDNLYKCLKNSDRYSGKVSSEKERAVRVYYESNDGEFYVDLVPMFQENEERWVVDHKNNIKEISGGFLFRDWINEQNNKTAIDGSSEKFLKEIIKIFKYFRNQNSISDIKSVQLTLLLARQVDKISSDSFSSISKCLYSIGQSLKQELEGCNHVEDLDLSNPKLPEEIFDRNFDEKKFQNFKTSFISLVDIIIKAYESKDEQESFSLRQSIFGDGLMGKENKITLVQYNFNHAKGPESKGYYFGKGLIKKIRIKCKFSLGNSPAANYVEKPHGRKINKGSKIRFYTDNIPYNINQNNVIWQVTNNSLSEVKRGEINNPSNNLGYQTYFGGFTIQEEAVYSGKHWVKCFVVNNNEIVAESDKFFINIQ